MLQFGASGGVTPDGQPTVTITFAITVPLKDADTIHKMIRTGGTQAVLALGQWNEQQAQSPSPVPSVVT